MPVRDEHGAEATPMGTTRLLGEWETKDGRYVLIVGEAARIAETDTYLSDAGSP